jgi:4-amino-4-deoxy-L-arabinose transferase-like glycosyltransferase
MKSRSIPSFVLILGIAVLANLPILIKGIPYGPDSFAFYRICISFYHALQQGEWFPSWVATSFGGYGDLSVRFYPPLTFYVAAFFRGLTGNWYTASLLLVTLFSLIGALGIYFWASSLITPKWAIVSAAIFCFLPFHVTELYTAFLFPQFAAAGFLALSLGCVERICQDRKHKHLYVAGLGAACGLLILTNLPLAVIGSLALALYSVLRLRRDQLISQLSALLGGAILGLLSSGFFLIKVLTETKWLSRDKNNYRAWYDYSHNFLMTSGPEGSALWFLNLIAIVTLVALLPSSFLILKHHRKRYAPVVVLAFAAFFMSMPVSKPLWLIIPKLTEVEFPWRWLSVATAASALAVGISFPHWLVMARGRYRPVALLALSTLLIAITFSLFQVIKGAIFKDRTEFNNLIAGIETKSTTRYWLPVWTPQPPTDQAGASLSSNQTFKVTSAGPFKIKTFYYPHWYAFMGDESLPVSPDADGSIVLNAPRAGEIRVVWVEPLVVKVARVLSLIVWSLLLGILVVYNFRQRVSRPFHPHPA